MANSKIPNVDLTDTFNTNRVRFNNLLDSVGDVSTLTTAATDVTSAINEHDAELGTITSGAMGTTAGTVSGAIAELDDRLDSINNTQIQSAKLLMNDSSAVSAIKGKLDVHGDLYAGGILYTDQIKSASASEQVFINDTLELQANDINDVNNIHLRTALIHDGDTNTKLEFGTDTIDLHTGGTARVAITNNDVTISENLTVQDSAYVTGNLAVGGNTTIGGTLTVDGEVTFKAGANSNINLGDGDGDNVVFNADVNSSIIPNINNTYDLGDSAKEWRHGYFDGTLNTDQLVADSATMGTAKVSDLTDNRVVIAGTGGELEDDANLTFDGSTFTVGLTNIVQATGNTNVGGDLDVSGNVQIDGNLTVDGIATLKAGADNNINLGDIDATTDTVTFNAEVASHITPDDDNTYDLGSSTKEWRHGYFDGTVNADNLAADSATLGTVKVTDLTAGRIVTVGTNGEVQDDADLTYSPTTDTLSVSNIDIGTQADLASAKVEDLTNNRIVIAGTGGELEDDANLTFDGTTLAATAAVDITGDLDVDNININGNTVTSTNTNGAINITPDGTGEVVISTATVSDLTNNRIVIAGTSGELEDDANLTFDGTTFSATAAVDITGDLDVDNININGNTVTSTNTNGAINITPNGSGEVVISTATVSDLTDNRIIVAGTSGALEDDANLTYDGTTFTVGATTIDQASGNTNIGGDLDVTGNLQVDGTLTVDGVVNMKAGSNGSVTIGDANTDNVVFSADVNSHIIPNTDNTYDLGDSAKEWRHGYFDGTVNADALAADSATLGTVKVSDLTNNRVVIAGTGGELEDDANLTYDGTTFEVGTNFDVDVATGNTNIDGNLDVDGTTDLDDTNVDGDLDVTGSFTTIDTDGLTEGDNNLYYTTARADSDARSAVSATDAGGDGSFAYDSATGVFTYTGPSAEEVIAHISAGEGINFNESGVISGEDATTANKGIASFSSDNFAVSSGEVTIKDDGITLGTETTGNYVATIAGTTNEIEVSGSGSETAAVTVGLTNDVTVGNNLTVTNDFTVGGRFTIAGEQRIAAQYIFLQDGTTGTPSLNSGITVDRGSEDSAVFQWNETGDYWEAGTKDSLNRLALQDDSANFTSLSVNNDLVVSGNLDVRGTTTTIDTTNLTIEDNLIILNGNQTGTPSTALRSGLEIERGDASNAKFQFNENTDEWEFTGPKTGTLAVTGDIGNATITLTAGTDLSTGGNFTTNQSGNETITINHADITRTNTTTTASPAYGASFTAIDTLTTNARGHVTGARTKTVTLPTYTHPTYDGDSASIDTGTLENATVISDLDFNITTDSLGHVTDVNATVATRDLTLANLGYTGATDANNYSLPEATSTVRGGIELFSNTDQSVAANSVTTTAGRTYGLQLNSANQAVMNVPWTDTNTTYSAGKDLDLNGTTFDIESTLNYVTAITTPSNNDFTLTSSGTGNIVLKPEGNYVEHYSNVRLYNDATFTYDNTFLRGLYFQGNDVNNQQSTYAGMEGRRLSSIGGYLRLFTEYEGWQRTVFEADSSTTVESWDGPIYLKSGAQGEDYGNSGGSGRPHVIIQDQQDTGANLAPPVLSLRNTDGTPTVGDTIGSIWFEAENDNNEMLKYAYVEGEIRDTADGGEDGKITLGVRRNGADVAVFDASATGNTAVSSPLGNLYLEPGAGDAYIRTNSFDYIKFTIDTALQTILASDELSIEASSAMLLKTSGGNIRLDTSTGIIDLFHNEFQDIRFDIATTDTLKLYTGASTLNSTFAGDDLTVQGDINSVSDVRIKENIETVENGLDLVSQLRGVWYNKIAEEDRKVGVIAQEVEEVLPEVVHTDTEGMKSVDYGKMVGVLIEAIKELKQEIDELKGN